MRNNVDNKYINRDTNLKLFKELSKLTGLHNYTFRNMMYLLYHGYIHLIACESRDANNRLKEVKIEIFNIGCITLDTSDVNNIKLISFELEDEFLEDIKNAVKEGESPIQKDITEKFIKDITSKYTQLL